MEDSQRDRLCIVLVRARNPNNIGAAARAMHDFGFQHLRLVNDYTVSFEKARSAVDANDVLSSAVHCPSLAEAVADCTLVIGTTSVGERDLDHRLYPLAQAAPLMLAELANPDARVALLFGSEKTGLSNEELSHCHWLLTIPMQSYEDTRHASMNLGQSVAVCLYEFVRDAAETAGIAGPAATNATAAELEQLNKLLGEVLEQTEYTRRHPANSHEDTMRRLVLRMSLERGDAAVWLGILRQILWKLGKSN